MPFPDASLDGVLCGYALRNFTDLALSLERSAASCGRAGGSRARGASPSRALADGPCHLFERVVPSLAAPCRTETHTLPAALDAYLPKESDLRQLLINAGFATVTAASSMAA